MNTINLVGYFDRKWTSSILGNISKPNFVVVISACVVIGSLYYAYLWFKVPFVVDYLPWFRELVFFEFVNDLRGSLFFLPVAYAAIIIGLQAGVITWLLSMVIMLPYLVYYSFSTSSLIVNSLLAILPLVIMILISLMIMWRKRERENLAEREKERQSFIKKILRAQEDERKRLTYELHDDTMQTLLVIAKRAHALTNNKVTENAADTAEWIRDATIQVSENIRRLCTELRPRVLDCMGLIPAIRWLSDQLEMNGSTDCRVIVDGKQHKLSPDTEVVIFRIIQEALNNIRLHSSASEASITLKYTPAYLYITIQDDGSGFSLRKTKESFAVSGQLGLGGMKQRANSIGGKLKIISGSGKGTSISLKVKV